MDEQTKKVIDLLTSFATSMGMDEASANEAAISFLQGLQTKKAAQGGTITRISNYLGCLKKGGVNCGCNKK